MSHIALKSLTDRKKEQAHLNEDFHNACKEGNLEKVIYLLESPDLPLHANIHSDNDLGLRLASTFKQIHVIDYILSSPLFVPPSFHSKYSVLDKAQEQVMEYIIAREKNQNSAQLSTPTNIMGEIEVKKQMPSDIYFDTHSQQMG